MKKAKVFAGITLLSGVALTLAACGKPSNQNANEASTAAKFSSVVPKKATKNGGTVKVAVETDTPFTGIFNVDSCSLGLLVNLNGSCTLISEDIMIIS